MSVGARAVESGWEGLYGRPLGRGNGKKQGGGKPRPYNTTTSQADSSIAVALAAFLQGF